jgi:hypothetical protein
LPDGSPVDPFENDDYLGIDYYHHNEFTYHVINAMRLQTLAYDNSCIAADLNADGLASLTEIAE